VGATVVIFFVLLVAAAKPVNTDIGNITVENPTTDDEVAYYNAKSLYYVLVILSAIVGSIY
jgi:hypothetical protein